MIGVTDAGFCVECDSRGAARVLVIFAKPGIINRVMTRASVEELPFGQGGGGAGQGWGTNQRLRAPYAKKVGALDEVLGSALKR